METYNQSNLNINFPLDHIRIECAWLNFVFKQYITQIRQLKKSKNYDNFSGFYISDEEIDAIINDPKFIDPSFDSHRKSKDFHAIFQARKSINEILEKSYKEGKYVPFFLIKKRFGLDDIEFAIVIILTLCQTCSIYEKIIAYIQNDLTKNEISTKLIIDLLGQTQEQQIQYLQYFHPDSTLRKLGVIEVINIEEPSVIKQILRINPQLVFFIIGNQTLNPTFSGYYYLQNSLPWKKLVMNSELQKQIRCSFKKILNTPNHGEKSNAPILFFHGRQGIGKKAIIDSLGEEYNTRVIFVNLGPVLENEQLYVSVVRSSLFEALLMGYFVCYTNLEKLEISSREHFHFYKLLFDEIFKFSWITFICSTQPLPNYCYSLANVYPFDIPAPSFIQQKNIWIENLKYIHLEDKKNIIQNLACRFNLTGKQIAETVSLYKRYGISRINDDPMVDLKEFNRICRLVSMPKLSSLAKKILPNYNWDQLILPKDQKKQLQELINQVRSTNIVLEEWGFKSKVSLGKGVSALFSGPSGTGKTMAAEVIASELALDLYKIDLSMVVSKYIGETEKNLRRIFSEAENSNAILFFDEADALLGKRSEVKDAHDRYANIEIAYLLQKMEEYSGTTILSTNLQQNIDDAFIRRIRFIVEFPLPEKIYRMAIWKKIWPENVPRADDIDTEFLARQFEISGGNIRNIALNAAFAAASNGGLVTMATILHATKRELQKMGKVCGLEDFGQYKDRVLSME